MRVNRKYVVTVALLAVFGVVFGLAGTTASKSEFISPQQPSSSPNSVAHFQNPPTFNSDWINVTDKCGQSFNVTHGLNSVNVTVDITGKTTLDGGVHQRHLGGTGCTTGWSKTYEADGIDESAACARSIVQTVDGGYMMAGWSGHPAYGGGFWVVKTDFCGNVLWTKAYSREGLDHRAHSVVETSDGGYAIAGDTYPADDFWLVKTNTNGDMQWEKTYGGAAWEAACSVVQTSDGGYALAGGTDSYGAGYADFWLVKTDAAGNVQWNKTYGGTNSDYARAVALTRDGGYALAGYTQSYGVGIVDFYLVKTNSTGHMQWNKTYGGTNEDQCYSMVQTSDGGYALAGYTKSFGAGDWDFWLVKTNRDGDILWNKTYGGAGRDAAYSLVQTDEGGYTLAGKGFADLVKTDSAGILQWNKTYAGEWHSDVYSVIQTSDGGHAMAGEIISSGAYTSSVWLVKTEVESGLVWTDFTNNTIVLYRGGTDLYWNYVRVRIWTIEEPTWQFGDINQDGVVDAQDLLILSKNYGKTFSLLSLSGIITIASIHTYMTRKQPK